MRVDPRPRDVEFDRRNKAMIEKMTADPDLREVSREWLARSFPYEYSYHFEWMGVPIIQYPQDLVALQEVIWQSRPNVVIEAGIARGGSVVFYASLLSLLGGDRRVIGIDVDIRSHNREIIESHPLAGAITLIERSSVDPDTLQQIGNEIRDSESVMVILDSNHTHEHVLLEMQMYAEFVSRGCYLVVFDTLIDELPEEHSAHRPWGPGNSPATAVAEFLKKSDGAFKIDRSVTDRLLLTAARDGFLIRV